MSDSDPAPVSVTGVTQAELLRCLFVTVHCI